MIGIIIYYKDGSVDSWKIGEENKESIQQYVLNYLNNSDLIMFENKASKDIYIAKTSEIRAIIVQEVKED